jgi:hypothetical protein
VTTFLTKRYSGRERTANSIFDLQACQEEFVSSKKKEENPVNEAKRKKAKKH